MTVGAAGGTPQFMSSLRTRQFFQALFAVPATIPLGLWSGSYCRELLSTTSTEDFACTRI